MADTRPEANPALAVGGTGEPGTPPAGPGLLHLTAKASPLGLWNRLRIATESGPGPPATAPVALG